MFDAVSVRLPASVTPAVVSVPPRLSRSRAAAPVLIACAGKVSVVPAMRVTAPFAPLVSDVIDNAFAS